MVIMEQFDFGNSIFSLEKIWKERTPVSQKATLYLSPDSNPYCSRLNPIFSFEIESGEENYLRYFNILSLRDGVYPLLRFFFLNPTPHTADPTLVIDEKLSSLVPVAWREKVLLRRLYVNEQVFSKEADECVILISPDQDALPLDVMESEFKKLAENTKHYSKISLYFSSCIHKGEEYAEAVSSWGYNVLNAFHKTFQGKEVEILSWSALQKKGMSKVAFAHFNPLHFYFSDSYLTHDLLQKGASLLEKAKRPETSFFKEEISINHGYYLFPWKDSGKKSLYDQVQLKDLFGSEIREKPAVKGFTFVTLTNKSFKDYAVERARELYQ